MNIGIDNDTIEAINNTFRLFAQIEKVLLFGSRAKGTFKEGSDIDFALVGKDLNLLVLSRLDLMIDELNLPYSFDLVIFDRIDNTDLVEHIERVGIVLYEK
jgi:predicted nucleotidyltransferase